MKYFVGLLLLLGLASQSFGKGSVIKSNGSVERKQIETFVFTSNGIEVSGKIYLPASYDASNNHPAIFLIDFTDQHFVLITDEFETLIAEAEKIQGLDALVVTLEEQLNVDAGPSDTQTYYDIFKDMALYVEANYSSNTSRTFVGRGSEAGLVMATMLLEDPASSIFDNFVATDSPGSFNFDIIGDIINGNFPSSPSDKKLHFSFSSSNDRNSCVSLINTINNAQLPWLQFSSEEYSQLTYPEAYPTAFSAGLNFIYDNVSTGVNSEPAGFPIDFNLGQNYPNPFNAVTTITYLMKDSGQTILQVYDSLGSEVSTIVNSRQAQGIHEVRFDASTLPTGVYHYRLSRAGVSKTKRMILMR